MNNTKDILGDFGYDPFLYLGGKNVEKLPEDRDYVKDVRSVLKKYGDSLLLSYFNSMDELTIMDAAYFFSELGVCSEELLMEVLPFLEYPNESVRIHCLHGLNSNCKRLTVAHISKCVLVANDQSWRVRSALSDLLANIPNSILLNAIDNIADNSVRALHKKGSLFITDAADVNETMDKYLNVSNIEKCYILIAYLKNASLGYYPEIMEKHKEIPEVNILVSHLERLRKLYTRLKPPAARVSC